MLISYNWLRELAAFDDSPSEIAARLTMAGLEVESMTALDQGLNNLVVGQILSKDTIPKTDHLTLCRIDVGKEHLQVVCGAPNHRVGDKVAVALPGARLPGGKEIRKAKIYGVESNGMICSEKELGISDHVSGVMILGEEFLVGAPAAEALGLKDTILELNVTPNRPDALSHLGVAREIAALTGSLLKMPIPTVSETGQEISSLSHVEIRDPALCMRYTARMVVDVTIQPSPLRIQQRLRAAGFRPINNVVDVTNYVLTEMGHPLHAFDFDLISQQQIVVRKAREGEKILTLDGVERELDPSMLAICDAEKPMAIAGIMGGEGSQVNGETRRIFLEAACFNPASIRRTSKQIGLHSESSHRFERGTDIEGMVKALDRAASLIQELAGGKIARGRIDLYPVKRSPLEIPIRQDHVHSILGFDMASDEINRILTSLSLEIAEKSEGKTVVRIPSFRSDLTREIDLIEELARIYGYNRIPSTLPHSLMTSSEMTSAQKWRVRVRRIIAGLGYQETIHYSFHNPKDLDDLNIGDEDPLRLQIRIRNPLSEDQSVLRSTLLPGLIRTLQYNLKRSLPDIRIFEIGHVFEPRNSGLPLEKNHLSVMITGKDKPLGWDMPGRRVDFFDLKGDLEELLDRLGIGGVVFSPQNQFPFLHPKKSAWIECGKTRLGFMGEFHPGILKKFELPDPVQYGEMDLNLCLQETDDSVSYEVVPHFPSVDRDIALILAEEISCAEVQERIRSLKPDLIREVRVFDLYKGKHIPEGKKSLAFRIRFQADDRTLTDPEINKIRDRIAAEMGKAFHAALRE